MKTTIAQALRAGVAPMVLALATGAGAARADEAAPSDAGQIVVTGTRIVAPAVAVAAPITTITAQDVQ